MGIKDMELNKRYIIDLSQATTPADVVFELSNIIEKPEASNQKVWLKLGDISLNQSQILSITSLISSINSTLALIETQSQQTELAATTLGISTKNIEDALQEELLTLEANSPEDAPSQQYVAMTDHLEDKENATDIQSISFVDSDNQSEQNSDCDINKDEAEKNLEAMLEDEDDNNVSTISNTDTTTESTESSEQLPNENYICDTTKAVDEVQYDNNTYVAEPMSEEKEEEIQNQLDSIFDSEAKLENILSGEKELAEMQNWPLTKESDDEFEIPEDEMTDEDYAILKMDTQYHKQTVRSGQVIKSNGNVVIIGDCHPGCEIHAAGDITVWGILGGIAHAGCNGNTKAKIRALTLNAIQLRIADSFARRPDHIKNIYVEKSNTFTPEEARNINGSIVILKVND